MTLFKVFLLLLLFINVNSHASQLSDTLEKKEIQKTDLEKQLIYNGRIWRNKFIGIKGDPYFLSGDFLWGNILFNGREFLNLRIKYDIFNDEVVLWVDLQTIIFLNKEMVNEFTIKNQDRTYRILNTGKDSTSLVKGFVNILYDGPTALFVKNVKKIDLQPQDKMRAAFYQQHRIYVRKDSTLIQVNGKRGLFKLLGDRITEVRDFVNDNRLNVSRKDPYSFVPVLEFYDGNTRP